jgi:hypothetical protein
METVKLLYPNEWRKNIPTVPGKKNLHSERDYFSWFLCSHRVLDEETDLYYADISPYVQFFDSKTGRSLSVREKDSRPRLLILSDPHNKKRLCGTYGYMCGCDSNRDILSRECSLTQDEKTLQEGGRWAIEKGYDGVVIRHISSTSNISHPVCSRATFVFREGILKPIGEDDPQRCQIIKYAKKFNSEIRERNKSFPTCSQIDNMLNEKSCLEVSQTVHNLL